MCLSTKIASSFSIVCFKSDWLLSMDTSIENEVVKVAGLVAEAKDQDIPGLLMQLRDIMKKYPPKSDQMKIFKKCVWKYDLLSWCAVVLKYDYTKVRGGLEGAVCIAEVFCECCCSINVGESSEFSEGTLPAAVKNIIHLLRLLQQRIKDSLKKPPSQSLNDEELAEHVFEQLKSLISVYPDLCPVLFNANDFLRLIMDDGKPSLFAFMLAHTAMQVNRFCVGEMSLGNLCSVLDEFVYKLTATEDANIAAYSTRIIVAMCNSCDKAVSIMSTRFKGLKAILSKWNGHGFNRDLNELISCLEDSSDKNALHLRQKNAVNVIWAYYIGWKTRKRMKTFHRALPTLQQSFRKKQQQKEETAAHEKSFRMQTAENNLNHRRSFRRTREKQLQSLQIVPAGKIADYIQGEEHKAATKIQAHWRSHALRKMFSAKQELHKQARAAIVIQRAVRKFLKLKKSMRSTLIEDLPTIKKEDRTLYMQEIERWQTLHKRIGIDRAEAESIQSEAHKRLVSFYLKKMDSAKENHQTDALLARIHTEEDTLNHLPSLSEASKETIDRLACNSLVVQRAAAIEHSKEKKQLTSSWWKRLAVEDDELARDGW